ncbi:MAG: hypothetical protein ACRC0V_05755 [Fusobacteriaceae bacterium]
MKDIVSPEWLIKQNFAQTDKVFSRIINDIELLVCLYNGLTEVSLRELYQEEIEYVFFSKKTKLNKKTLLAIIEKVEKEENIEVDIQPINT